MYLFKNLFVHYPSLGRDEKDPAGEKGFFRICVRADKEEDCDLFFPFFFSKIKSLENCRSIISQEENFLSSGIS
jgi:hypothetical protein